MGMSARVRAARVEHTRGGAAGEANLPPVEQLALVDLPDGGGGERLGRERLEDGRQPRRPTRHPQLPREDLLRLARVKGRHRVLQLAQLECVRLRDEVGADRERLRELDEGGTELRS